jgi:acyl carrier protein
MLEGLLEILNELDLNYNQVKLLTEDTNLREDLSFDSLDIIEFNMGVEDKYELSDINDDVVFNTVGDIIKYIEDNK